MGKPFPSLKLPRKTVPLRYEFLQSTTHELNANQLNQLESGKLNTKNSHQQNIQPIRQSRKFTRQKRIKKILKGQSSKNDAIYLGKDQEMNQLLSDIDEIVNQCQLICQQAISNNIKYYIDEKNIRNSVKKIQIDVTQMQKSLSHRQLKLRKPKFKYKFSKTASQSSSPAQYRSTPLPTSQRPHPPNCPKPPVIDSVQTKKFQRKSRILSKKPKDQTRIRNGHRRLFISAKYNDELKKIEEMYSDLPPRTVTAYASNRKYYRNFEMAKNLIPRHSRKCISAPLLESERKILTGAKGISFKLMFSRG